MRWTRRATGPVRNRRLATVFLAVGVAVALAGCGGDSDGERAAPAGEPAPEDLVLTIKDFAFSPATLRVPKGGVVTVVNEDDAPHTATADDGSFDSSELTRGERKTITLPDKGEVAFYCAIHDYMRGVIQVGP